MSAVIAIHRQAFIAPAGYKVLAADYSQIELRIMAHLSADEGLLTAFNEGKGVHSATASEVYEAPLAAVSGRSGTCWGAAVSGHVFLLPIRYIRAYPTNHENGRRFNDRA
jgi:hypothetical protein